MFIAQKACNVVGVNAVNGKGDDATPFAAVFSAYNVKVGKFFYAFHQLSRKGIVVFCDCVKAD